MYFITFSEKMGTNGSEIARKVADQLGYNFYDTEAIESAAQEMGFLCVFRGIPDTHSGAIRTPIPFDSGHSFQSIPDTL